MNKGNRHQAAGNSTKAKVFGFVLCAMLLALCVSASAQQPKKIPRIGYLAAPDAATEAVRAEGIRLALRERGYIDGQTIAIEYRYTQGKADRAPQLAAELAHLNVDLIVVAGGDDWVRAAKNTTQSIPIVMVGSGTDPIAAGLIESLARPGANVTGLTNLITELGGKRLELLKETIPRVARVAMIYDPGRSSNVLEVKEVQTVAGALGLKLQPREVRAVDDFEQVFSASTKDRAEAVYVAQGPLMISNQKRIVSLALKSRLPSVYVRRVFVDAGGLMSYGADFADSYRRVAYYVDRILKGTKPADLPVEQPTKFEFVINLKTAKQIGLTIPPNVLARADRVIK